MAAEDYMLPCINKTLFGVECMGCGTQRAIYLLFQGKFAEAFEMFPAIYTLIIFFFVVGLHFVDSTRSYSKAIKYLAIINGIIMIINYINKQFFI